MIYIAAPYWHEDFEIRNIRFYHATRYAAQLAIQGELSYSPLTYGHGTVKEIGTLIPEEYWRRHGLKMLSLCDRMVVLTMKGWETSRGVAAELELARQLSIPVQYINVDYLKEL